MNREKSISAKKAWGALKRDRDHFVWLFIACQGLLLKSGELTRDEVRDNLNEAGVTREDIERFRRQRANHA